MERLFHLVVDAAQGHPWLALGLVGAVAFAESLAIVGTAVPAAVLMIAAGVLVGQEVLALGPTLAVAVAGAIAGDALSFELGRVRSATVSGWRVFRAFGGAVGRAEGFVRRHGAMSVVLARFTGAVRAFVPLLAGSGHMPRWRFYSANVGSALLWAPVHILPGVLLGGSLQLVEAVSGRLAMMVMVLLGLLALAVFIVNRGVRWLLPLLRRARERVVRWAAGRRGRLPSLLLALLDPERPGSHALLAGALLLVGAGWVFLGLLEDVVNGDPLVQLDQAVNAFFQSLRTLPVDRLMVVVTEMGSGRVLWPLILVAGLWLLWRGCRHTLVMWAGSAAVGELLVWSLKLSLGRHRPARLYAGIESFSFPSGHATMCTVVFAMLAFLLSRGASFRARAWIIAVTTSLVAMVAVSRLYLGAHWLSDVLAGVSLGLVWVAFCAMVYVRRGVHEPLHAGQFAALAALTVAVATTATHRLRGAADLSFYALQPAATRIVDAGGAPTGWPGVPRRRREFGGDLEERFAVQWACQGSGIVQALRAAGWQPGVGLSATSVLRTLGGGTDLAQTPVLPRFDRGQPNTLGFVRTAAGSDRRQVLRLWAAPVALAGSGEPLPVWYGTLYDEQRRAAGLLKGWMRLAAVDQDGSALAQALAPAVQALHGVHGDGVLRLRCGR